MKIGELTDYEQLLFERLHTKALQKIIKIKNQQISELTAELKIRDYPDDDIEDDPSTIIYAKDEKRIATIKTLTKRLKYYKKRYNSLLRVIRFTEIPK